MNKEAMVQSLSVFSIMCRKNGARSRRQNWIGYLFSALICLICLVCLCALPGGSVYAAAPRQADSPLATPLASPALDEAAQEAPDQETPVQENERSGNSGLETLRTTAFSIDLGLVLIVVVLAVLVLVAGYQTWRPQ